MADLGGLPFPVQAATGLTLNPTMNVFATEAREERRQTERKPEELFWEGKEYCRQRAWLAGPLPFVCGVSARPESPSPANP